MGGFRIMTKVKTFTVGLPVTDLNSAVEWYRGKKYSHTIIVGLAS
jgi:hypothetical protein